MRVISQDGTIDLPYEQVIIQCFKKNIYFLNKNLIGVEQLICDRVVAKYSTEEKAKKAMEMLRIAYTGSIAMFQNVEPTVAYVTDYIEKNPDDTNYRYIPKYGDWLKEDCDYWIRQVEKRKRGESS